MGVAIALVGGFTNIGSSSVSSNSSMGNHSECNGIMIDIIVSYMFVVALVVFVIVFVVVVVGVVVVVVVVVGFVSPLHFEP